jgi:AcrR family transcriptional regulator
MATLKSSSPKQQVDLRREDRCNAMMDAAEMLFLERGFERTSLSAIVARSGGSLATLYDQFGSKQNLLHAVVARMRDDAFKDLQYLKQETLSPRAALLQLACRFHAFAMDPRKVAMMRVVIAQGLNDPEFGRAIYRDMHLRLIKRLAATFQEWSEQGKAVVGEPDIAAELYVASIMCDARMRAMMGMAPEPTDERILSARLQPFLEHFQIKDG